MHRRVAEALQELDPDRLDERAALLAQHWEAAGDHLAAARWSARAASWVGLNDIAEAVRHWRKVSELVEALPDSPESSALALGARVQRLSYGWRLGISEQEASAHYEAGRELAQRSGDPVNLLLITAAYATVRGTAGHVEEFGELGEEVNRLSIEIGDPALRMAMLTAPAYARWVAGRSAEALAMLDEGVALGAEDPALGGGIALVCPYAWCLLMRGIALTGMGYPEEAAASLERALQAAQEQGDLESESWTHGAYVALARSTGQTELALAHATQGYELAERIGDAFSRIFALYSLGYARFMRGETARRSPRSSARSSSAAKPAPASSRSRRGWRGCPRHCWAPAIAIGRWKRRRSRCGSRASAATRGCSPSATGCSPRRSWPARSTARLAAAQEALEKAAAAAEATGLRSELPFIERAREKLVPVG